MKTIKILILSGVFLSTTLSVAQKTWSNNRYTFNNDGGGDKMYLNIDDNTAHAVEFSVGNSIDHISFLAPKVGIGTRSPSEKLEVSGNVKATQFIGDGSQLTGILNFGASTRQMINLYNNSYGIGIQSSTQYFRSNNHFAWYKGGVHMNEVLNPGSGGTAHMVLRKNGSLGVGTTNPSEKLEVSGNVKATQFIGDGSRLTNVNPSGDFGDTDITTHGIVHIYNKENDALTIQTPDNTQSNGVAFQNSMGAYTWNIFREDVGNNYADLVFASGLTTEIADLDERFRITTNGKIGIGTNSPSEKLDVDGNAKAIGIIVTGDGANTNTIDSNIDGTIVFGGEDGSTLTNAQISDSFYPDFAVWVEEGIVTEDIAVAPSSEWDGSQPDYVFETDYELPSLEDVEVYVTSYKHLEGIPSKAEVAEKGWSLPSMDQKLLKKVEELTLYTIQQEKEIKALKALVENLVETIKN